MTPQDLHRAAHLMIERGGSFAASIGSAYLAADSDNRRRLVEAFGDLFARTLAVHGAE